MFKCEGNRRFWSGRAFLREADDKLHPPKDGWRSCGHRAYSGQWIHLPTGQRLNTEWGAAMGREDRECCRPRPRFSSTSRRFLTRLKALFLLRLLGSVAMALLTTEPLTQTPLCPGGAHSSAISSPPLFRHSLSPCPIPILLRAQPHPFLQESFHISLFCVPVLLPTRVKLH